MSLNKVMLIGNVGKDPEVRYLEGKENQPGNPQPPKVASFTLATTERYRDRNNELRENTEWHNIVVWRSQADVVEKYVKKGTQLFVEGRLRSRSWDDQSGGKHYITEVVADNVQMLGRKSDNPANGGVSATPCQPARPYQPAPAYQQPSSRPAADAYNQPAGFQPSYNQVVAKPEPDSGEDDLPF